MTLSRTSSLPAIGALAALALMPLAAPSQGAVPAVVAKAASVNEVSLAGTVVHHREITIDVSAGPAHYAEKNEALVVLKDGAFTHLRYLNVVRNGKSLSPDELASRNDEINASFEHGSGFFHQPYDRRYFQEYVYGAQVACRCTADESQIPFHSTVRDEEHGDGTMRIDNASGRVIEVIYTPNQFPHHASAGTTTETFGEPLPGMWTIVRIDRTYSGRIAFVKGGGHVTETLDRFRQFNTVNAGLAFVRSFGN